MKELDDLCVHLTAEKGYAIVDDEVLEKIPELVPFTRDFDRLLLRSDGYMFEIISIKNRLQDPTNRNTVSLEGLRNMGKPCLQYTGQVQSSKLPVSIKVWEICNNANADIAHLKNLRCWPLRQKVAVSAASLCLTSQTAWTNARFKAGKRYLESVLRKMSHGDVSATTHDMTTNIRRPIMTYSLVALMIVFFILQLVRGDFEGLLSPTLESLVALGGLNRTLVINAGQWHRIFSAGFLHGSLLHLGFNDVALYLSSFTLENWVSRSWLLTIFGLSLLGGSAASLLINGPEIVSVGASGAIMGMLVTAYVLSHRLPFGHERTSIQMNLLYLIIPALIPLATKRGEKVDFAAHLGGAITGLLLGFIIPKIKHRGVSIGIAVTLAIAMTMSLVQTFL